MSGNADPALSGEGISRDPMAPLNPMSVVPPDMPQEEVDSQNPFGAPAAALPDELDVPDQPTADLMPANPEAGPESEPDSGMGNGTEVETPNCAPGYHWVENP